MKNIIYILGIGHNTPVVIDLAQCCGYEVVGIYHYNDEFDGTTQLGIPVLGSYQKLRAKGDLNGLNYALSMGNNVIRRDLALEIRALGGSTPSLIHPKASVSQYAKLGQGAHVRANATIDAGACVGDDCCFSANSYICHDSNMSEGCYVAAGAIIGAYVNIESGVFIGMGAVIISGKVPAIGQGAYIGAGAVVTKSVSACDIVYGSPAKSINSH